MDFVSWLRQIDTNSVLFLNSFVENHVLLNKTIDAIGQNAFVRGFPVFFPLVALWFAGDDQKRRARISAGLFASFLAVVISISIQHKVYIHTRPFLDESLHLNVYDPTMAVGWDRLSSFPSDTATLFFSLCVVIFRESRLAGSIAFFWCLFSVGIMRVLIGFHYPSDILGSLMLGPSLVVLIGRNKYVVLAFEYFLNLFKSTQYIVHALFFIALAEAYNLFAGLRHVLNGLEMFAKRLIGLH